MYHSYFYPRVLQLLSILASIIELNDRHVDLNESLFREMVVRNKEGVVVVQSKMNVGAVLPHPRRAKSLASASARAGGSDLKKIDPGLHYLYGTGSFSVKALKSITLKEVPAMDKQHLKKGINFWKETVKITKNIAERLLLKRKQRESDAATDKNEQKEK